MYHSFLGGVLFLFVYPQQENTIVSFGSVEWNQNPWHFQKAPCHPGVALASHPSTIELSCQVMAWLKLGKLYELYVSNKSHSQWFKIDVLKASSSCEMLEAMIADSLSPQMQKRLGEKLPFNPKKRQLTQTRENQCEDSQCMSFQAAVIRKPPHEILHGGRLLVEYHWTGTQPAEKSDLYDSRRTNSP